MGMLNPKWKQHIMEKNAAVTALNSATVRVFLVDEDAYPPTGASGFENDVYLSDAPTGAFALGGLSHDGELGATGRAYFTVTGTKTCTNGTFSTTATGGTFQEPDADPGVQKEVLLFVDWKTSSSDSVMILYMDGITVTENGADITVGWNDNGIFTL